MNTTITSRHFELTDSIKSYIFRLSESLEKYNLDILSTRIVISYQEKKGKEKTGKDGGKKRKEERWDGENACKKGDGYL